MNYMAYFERNSGICGGQWVIKGTRIPVRTVLASLAEGAGIDEIVADFPTLRHADVRAVIAFAASAVEDDMPIAEAPAIP